MKAFFRVDASPRIGIGHAMRCLTLATHLRRRGWTVGLIARELPEDLARLSAVDFRLDVLRLPAPTGGGNLGPLAHSEWLGERQQIDAEQTLTVLRRDGEPIDLIVVDHYGIGADWEMAIRPGVGRVLVIDDLADRTHECDILLDQNFFPEGAKRYAKLVPSRCRLLIGPRYALLRDEFPFVRETQDGVRARTGEIRRILVSFGGTDASGETSKTLEALSSLRGRVEIDVLVGPTNRARADIQARAESTPDVTCYNGVPDMAELMARADLLIGAGGMTIWESCCLGLPSIVTATAANQRESCRVLAERGYVIHLGKAKEVSVERIRVAVSHLMENPWLVRYLSAASAQLTDGRGASRVAKVLDEVSIILRRARPEDCRDLHVWRNAPENRRYAFEPAPIAYDVHARWFEDSLRRPDRVLLVGEAEGIPRGVLRYDLGGTRAKVSIYLVPGSHGQGWGSRLLRAGTDWVREHLREVGVLQAEVLWENEASREVFRRAGYRESRMVFEHPLQPEAPVNGLPGMS